MNVLILGTIPSPLRPIIDSDDCHCIEHSESFDFEFLRRNDIDFAVSYRYRHMVDRSAIELLKGNIINLHISLLPWNRGADPNLWSFLENTPKGVSIHFMDKGLDTGDIISQKGIRFECDSETLASTYYKLNYEIIELFRLHWPLIKVGRFDRRKQPPGGTHHRLVDKEPYRHLFADQGWNTPVASLVGKALNNSMKAT